MLITTFGQWGGLSWKFCGIGVDINLIFHVEIKGQLKPKSAITKPELFPITIAVSEKSIFGY